jgi:hypothetical protein
MIMSKKKVSVKVAPGEAIFIADAAVLEHIAEVYESMAESELSEDSKAAWINVSLSIREWVAKTYVPIQEDYEDEEW